MYRDFSLKHRNSVLPCYFVSRSVMLDPFGILDTG